MSLTTGANNFTGTAGNDTFSAALDAGVVTADGQDDLDGGAGTDTLAITVNGNATYQLGSVANIENINLNSTATTGTLSMTGVTGATKVASVASTGAAAFTNIGSSAVAAEVKNTGQNATFTYTNAALQGASDTVNLTVQGVSAGTTTIQATSGTNGAETIAITTAGSASTVTLDDGAMTTLTRLNISGSQDLTLTTTPTTITTVNASTLTGALTHTANGAAAVTVTGGSGNDALTRGNAFNDNIDGGAGNDRVIFTANLDNNDTLAGGTGTDALVATDALLSALTTSSNRTGFETVEFSDAFANNTTLANIQAGINTVVLAAGGTGTLTMEAGAKALQLSAAVSAGGVTVVDTGTATTDSLTISNTATTALDVYAARGYTSTGYETVTISTTGAGAATTQTLGAVTVTPDTGGTAVLNITGSNAATATTITADKLDVSGLTAAASGSTFTMTASSGIETIIGSAGNDTLVGDADGASIEGGAGRDNITGGAGNDTMLGGDGNDTITSGAGNDSISAGAGNDRIVMASDLATGDILDGGDGVDELQVTGTATTGSMAVIAGYSISAANALNANISNIERVRISDAFNVGAAFDMARLDSINHITFVAGTTGAEELSGLVNGSTLVIGDDSTLTATLADATGTADSINFQLTDLDGTASNETVAGLTTSGIETVNISLSEDTASATVYTHTITTLTATGATAVNISGTEALTVTNATSLRKVDASGLTAGALNISVANSAVGATVTGGAGDDVVTGSANADVLSGGAGADNLVGGADNDTIDGGIGADTLVGGTGNDSITAGEGADVIVGSAGNDTIILTESTAATDDIQLGRTDAAGTNLAVGSGQVKTVTGFTAGTGGDLLSFDIGGIVVTNTTQKVATLSADGATLTSLANTAAAGDVDIVIVLGEYGSYAAVQATLNASATVITDATDGAIVVWRDGSGNTQVYFDTNISAGAGTGTQLAALTGVNTANLVAANFDVLA